jgi:hypothetical protein
MNDCMWYRASLKLLFQTRAVPAFLEYKCCFCTTRTVRNHEFVIVRKLHLLPCLLAHASIRDVIHPIDLRVICTS